MKKTKPCTVTTPPLFKVYFYRGQKRDINAEILPVYEATKFKPEDNSDIKIDP